MPGHASWKTLYKEEYRALYEEGYPVGDSPKPDLSAEYLPFPAEVRGELEETAISEAEWQTAQRHRQDRRGRVRTGLRHRTRGPYA